MCAVAEQVNLVAEQVDAGSRSVRLEAVGIQTVKHVPLTIHVLVQVQNAVLGRSLG